MKKTLLPCKFMDFGDGLNGLSEILVISDKFQTGLDNVTLLVE